MINIELFDLIHFSYLSYTPEQEKQTYIISKHTSINKHIRNWSCTFLRRELLMFLNSEDLIDCHVALWNIWAEVLWCKAMPFGNHLRKSLPHRKHLSSNAQQQGNSFIVSPSSYDTILCTEYWPHIQSPYFVFSPTKSIFSLIWMDKMWCPWSMFRKGYQRSC